MTDALRRCFRMARNKATLVNLRSIRQARLQPCRENRRLVQAEADNAKLAAALKALYEHDAEYITMNHLGPVNHNQVMQDAFDAIYGHNKQTKERNGSSEE